jgi:hypothetical protein
LKKAYDLVIWSFLNFLLVRFGFGDKWQGWMKTYVFFGSLLVLANGSPTEQVNINKELK